MNDEFTKTGVNTVASSQGFVVEVKFAGGLLYRDARNEVEIDSEWLVESLGVLVYKKSGGHKGFENMDQARVDAIFENAIRALRFLGYQVEA